jgi:hypothetical protein
MELGVRLSFVKTLEFRRVGVSTPPPQPPLGTPLLATHITIQVCVKLDDLVDIRLLVP